jgi:DNA-binding LytR/AlgR family response regulator
MRIGICDDERVFLDLLTKYCRKCATYLEGNHDAITVETFCSGEELLEAYSKNDRFDILYLDLKMKRINGFETARQVRNYDSRVIIIFITSLSQYVMKSFEYKPFWYLVKPVSEEKFRSVFIKAISEYSSVNFHEYTFKTREEGIERININDIIYLESISRQIRLHTSNEDYYFYAGINREEEKLKRFDFIRIHKSYLVNVQHIRRINKTNVTLKNGHSLPISERRHKAVLDFYTDYLARSSL